MMNPKTKTIRSGTGGIDWPVTVIPLVMIGCITAVLLLFPQQSNRTIDSLWNIFVNKLGFFLYPARARLCMYRFLRRILEIWDDTVRFH